MALKKVPGEYPETRSEPWCAGSSLQRQVGVTHACQIQGSREVVATRGDGGSSLSPSFVEA
jgi:hypothetical protein